MVQHRASEREGSNLWDLTMQGFAPTPKRSDSPAPPHLAACVEELESRLLLSVAVATPDFARFRPVGPVQPAAATSPVGLTPAQVRHAYGIDQTMFGSVVGDGSGQTIAIVDAYNDPNIVADLHAFDVQFGLSDPTLIRLGETGTTTLPGTDPAGRGNSWAMEISLDVEWAHVVAPKATIVLVEANSPSDTDLYAAIDTARKYPGVSAVSMSWGGGETSQTYDTHFTTPAGHTGVTFVASSGDSGAYISSRTLGVESPASSPNVLAVGGTRLTTNSSGAYLGESGWGNGTSSYSYGGSGGGISRYVTIPSYQRGVMTQSTTKRGVPDVSFLADPASGVAVYDSWDSPSSPWAQIGGTSLAAPMWAGVIALIDQGLALAGKPTLDGATQTIPKIYALPGSAFHDITSGNNGYAAGSGYDLVTGRGSPIVNLLVADMVGSPASVITVVPTVGTLTVNPASVVAGASVTLTAAGVQETGGTIKSVTFYRESDGLAGLTGDTLLGSGTQSGTTWTLSTATAGLAPGTYTYYAVATDAANVTSMAAVCTVMVTAPAPVNDNFSAGTVLTGTAAHVVATNVGATRETGEPVVYGTGGGKSVWYTWTAPASGRVTIDTAGSSFDTTLGVYTGSTVSTTTAVATNDDISVYNANSVVSFMATAGVTYHIAVDGYAAASGSIVLNLAETVAPANDAFSAAHSLAGRGVTWTGTNVGATRQSGEPYIANNGGGASVWVAWTAPTSGAVSLNTYGSNFDTMLGVYTGSSVSALTLVASNDDDPAGWTLTSALTFNAVAGQTYYFAIDGYNGAMGNIVLNLA